MKAAIHPEATDLTEVKTVTVPKTELSLAQVSMIRQIFESIFPDMLGVHEKELNEASLLFDVASRLCARAAEIHHGLQVPWRVMCYEACLSPALSFMAGSQESLATMLGPIGVDVIRQEVICRGCATPGFKKAE